MSAATSYTITNAADQQPASLSFECLVEDPQIAVKGLRRSAGEFVDVWKSHDGNDPTSDDSTGVRILQNGTFELKAKVGHKIIFKGLNLDGSSSITIEIESA